PETLNFIVRDLGISLTELMTGQDPGVFCLGMQLKPSSFSEISVVAHVPARAQISAMPANYAVERFRRVGGMEKLEQYSLAAQMIKANAMVLPNKKGECPLGDDEIGISIRLSHLRGLLIARLKTFGVMVIQKNTMVISVDSDGVQAQFIDGSRKEFDAIISTAPNYELFGRVQLQQTVQWVTTDRLPAPSAELTLDVRGWMIMDAVAQGKRCEIRSIGWGDKAQASMHNSVGDGEIKHISAAWFGAYWQDRIVCLSDSQFFGAEFLLDPLQPVIKVVQLLTHILPVQTSADLLARYFNERVQAISLACREYIIAHLIESSIENIQDLVSEQDRALYWQRKTIYQTLGEPVQPAANLISDGIWAAFWHAHSIYPQSASNLLRSFDLDETLHQARTIESNITEIIPRLPTHQYYISLLNGGGV
ncbi:MAG TPA: hypothetical protein PKZ52_13625, partial [Cellvibrionaceae bacterium]|nr:hypothetical protein [Cellvibrionaceae bacterium]